MAYCMYIYTVYTVYSMYLCVAVPSTFSTIINFLVGTNLVAVLRCCAGKWDQECMTHTRLHTASADARLVHKYFSSKKRRATMLPVVVVGKLFFMYVDWMLINNTNFKLVGTYLGRWSFLGDRELHTVLTARWWLSSTSAASQVCKVFISWINI